MPAQSFQDAVFTASAKPVNFPNKSVDDQKKSLTKANEAMYKQNLELATRNKTLNVLRTIATITVNATGAHDVSQRIADAIVSEMKFASVFIALIDEQSQQLHFSAIALANKTQEEVEPLLHPTNAPVISLKDRNNLMAVAVQDHERKITGNLLDVITPLSVQEAADHIENITHVKTIVSYPLFLGEKALGVLNLGLAKKVDDLSRGEKETLDELIDAVAIAINRAQLVEDIRNTNDKLSSANKQLEVLDKLKDEFVSVASHELRTPMTAIKSYAWMLLNNKAGDITPKAREYLDRVFRSTERLIHLVNEMLDVSRIESGRVKLNLSSFNPGALCDDIQNEFSAKVSEAGLTFAIDRKPEFPTIIADREKIQQVLENLIGNSVKYSPRGAHISLHVMHDASSITFAIKDTGRGIPPDDIQRLFKKFGRLENSLVTVTAESSGLGLYISKQYVELHRGTIQAESVLGKGSTFTFTLPLISEAISPLQKKEA